MLSLLRLACLVALMAVCVSAVSAQQNYGDLAAFPDHEPMAAQEQQDIALAQVASSVAGQRTTRTRACAIGG